MNKLNIGCGTTFHPSWVNIDFEPSSPLVQQYDIRKGLPYADNVFDVGYCSHVLEHLKRVEADKVLKEIYRVLKPGGIVRLVVPDLEKITRAYLSALERVMAGDKAGEPDYDWMMLELYDQTVRHLSSGEMGRYLKNPDIKNKEFIAGRIGLEAEQFWSVHEAGDSAESINKLKYFKLSKVLKLVQRFIAENLVAIIAGIEGKNSFKEGLFRNSGEIHRWMYDRFSLSRLMEQAGFKKVCVCEADESRIPDFNNYQLDILEGNIRKPDSMFMEAMKP